MDENEPKLHIGKKYRVTLIGGSYHNKLQQLRAPIEKQMEIAGPPIYQGDDNYSSNFKYETYYLRFYKDEPYYVEQSILRDWEADPEGTMNQTIESENERRIRLEREEKKRQEELLKKDFEEVGISVVYRGKRLRPSEVVVAVNYKHPTIKAQIEKALPAVFKSDG